MHPLTTTDTLYVFGLSWWPFDGAVTAALIALIGTGGAIWFNRRRFLIAERNQSERHAAALESTSRLSGREQLLIDLRRAEDALASDNERLWIYASVTLRHARTSEYATADDRRRVRAIIKGYAARFGPRSTSSGVT